jgi:iron complex outermembrane receptor protein
VVEVAEIDQVVVSTRPLKAIFDTVFTLNLHEGVFMSTNSKLQTAIRAALNMSVGAGALALTLAPNAFAQSTDADEDQTELPRLEIEETTVTGSRIRRADLDSASPVTILDRDDIIASGITDVGSLIQRMPAMSGSPIGTTTNNGGNGSVQIDLRGMGAIRTLTLVNGKRTVDGGDYQTIPAHMIERVEILKDGASAVYGADAVAGVVNIITRRDFEGIEVNVQTADWFDAAGQQTAVGLIAGKAFDGGNFVFGAEFVDQEQAFQSDTPWDFFGNSYYIYPEGCENQVASPYDGTGSGATSGCYPIGSSRIPQSRLTFFSQGTFLVGTAASSPYEVGAMIPHDGRTYNYAPVNYIQTPYERTNIFAEAHFDLTDNVRFTTEIRGNYRTSSQELAPLPFTGGDPMHEGNYNGTAYTGVSENNYYLRRAVDAYNSANGASLVYEPLVTPRRRMIETNRRFEQTINQYQWTAQLEGEINDMSWDAFINEGYRNREDHDLGQFSGERLNNALGPSADLDGDGQPECYTDTSVASTLIVGCVPLNMFGGGEVDPITSQPTTTTLTDDMVAYVSLNTVDTFISKQRSAGATISGSNFELPGGELGWALGYGYWKQEFTYTPDSAKTIGAVTGNVGAGTDGHLTNNSLFLEFLAPLYDNGSQALLLKGGLRYDDWDAFAGDTTYQLGVEFNATEDLKFRATYGTVFRAPTIGELFGGQVDSFPTYSDPCVPVGTGSIAPGCAQQGVQLDNQLLARVGGNPNLIPETGDTLTAGFVWTPTFGDHGLTATVDYWTINLDDGISSLGVQFILDDCYIRQNQTSCDLVTRAPNYSIDNVIDGSLNVASQGGEGVDTEIRWNYSADHGQWQAAMLWAHLIERTKTPFAGSPEQDFAGRSTDPTAADGGTYAGDKVNYSVQWLWNDFSVGYMGEYISGLDADTYCNCGAGNTDDGRYVQDIPSQLYHDIVASYSFDAFGSNASISGGVTNLTDEAPPFIEIGFNASTDPSTYRLFGIGYYLRLAFEF